MALPGDEHEITLSCTGDGMTDRHLAVEFDELRRVRHTRNDGRDDRFRGFIARIVTRDDDTIGEAASHLTHLRALPLIAIATCAEHDGERLGRKVSSGMERSLQAIGGVGEVNNDTEVLTNVDGFEATRHTVDLGQRGSDGVRLEAQGDHNLCCDTRIGYVEGAGKR